MTTNTHNKELKEIKRLEKELFKCNTSHSNYFNLYNTALEEVEKMIKKSFSEGDEIMKDAEDTLFKNSSIKKMLYTPYGIFKGTEQMILQQLKKLKEKEK